MKKDHLDIKEYIAGECFICKGKVEDPESYLHYECAVAYSDDKEKRRKEALDKQEK